WAIRSAVLTMSNENGAGSPGKNVNPPGAVILITEHSVEFTSMGTPSYTMVGVTSTSLPLPTIGVSPSSCTLATGLISVTMKFEETPPARLVPVTSDHSPATGSGMCAITSAGSYAVVLKYSGWLVLLKVLPTGSVNVTRIPQVWSRLDITSCSAVASEPTTKS